MKAIPTVLLLLLVAAGHAPGLGQAPPAQKPLAQMPASARQLIAIKVTGSKRFPEDAIAATTSLQLGTTIGEDDFKTAARHLGDTGAFRDIAYTYSYSSAGTKLELQVTDAEKFVPARFEDFVWFSDSETLRRIQEHVPLFDGELPLSGRMADEVSDVLQAMLVENAIPGHVNYVRNGKEDGPVESIDYTVADVLIRVRNIEFTGVAAADLPALEVAARRFSGREYSRSHLDAFVKRQLLPVYHAQGYLKAACGAPQPKVVKPPAAETEEGPRSVTLVDVTFAVAPGRQYKLKGLEWSGNHEVPTDTLQKMIRADIGQPANTVRLAQNLQEVQKLYGSRGFIATSIKVDAEFDDVTGMVAIRLVVNEDSVYHMGELTFRGLDNSLTAKLREAWKLREGDVYDATYLDTYLPEEHQLLPARLDWEVASHVTANVRDKTVDVDLIFSVKAPE
jgi:outer membrane protein assembly factor BamA